MEVWRQSTRAGNDLKVASFGGVLFRVTDDGSSSGRPSWQAMASGWLGDTELVGHWNLRRIGESHLSRHKKPWSYNCNKKKCCKWLYKV